MSEPKLTVQQQAVVDDRGGTLLVSAAAGSGKTKVLVDRVMQKIRRDGKNIHEFLIITFTNAAAAELRGKISEALVKALAEEPQNKHLSRQLNLLQLAQISTVHAFCGALLRQYGYLLEVPSDYGMLEEVQRQEILGRLLDDLLEEEYAKKEPGFLLLADTFGAGRSDSALVELILELFEKLQSQPYPEKWLRSQETAIPPETELSDTAWGKLLIEDARQQITWLIARYDWAIAQMQGDDKLSPKYLPAYETQREALGRMLSGLDCPWDEIAPVLTMDYPRLVVRSYPDQDRLDAIKAVKNDGKKLLETLQKRFSRSGKNLIAEQNAMAPALQALLGLVGTLDERFSKEKRRKNLLDFSDQEHLSIRLLVDNAGKPTQVAQEVSERFTEIMVDEYQDSNRVQELIFTAISQRGDRNRFLVGDVKQSIYGFRQAEPGIFLEKYQRFTEATQAEEGSPRKLVLSKNFRSRPEILEAANHVFSCVMSPELGGLHYGPQERLYPGLEEYPPADAPRVELQVLSFPKLPEGENEELTKYQREAAWVADRIVRLLKENSPVRDGSGERPIRPDDIAILFRSKEPMSLYQRALKRAGVPVASTGETDLFETTEVQVLMSLLRVIDNPHQDIPLLAVLASPLFRLGNDQLAKIRTGSQKRRLYDAMGDCQEAWCRTALEKIEQLRALSRTMSAEKLVWQLLHETGLLLSYSAMEDGMNRRENLLAVYELARQAASGGYLYLYELLRFLERTAKAGTQTGKAGSSGVVLSTIHKSKGLEYPVVFLSDLSRKFNFRELSESVLVDADVGIGAKITDTDRRIRYPGLGYEAIRVKKRQALLSEELRILYVAMTRPKDYLFMTYSTGEGDKYLKKLVSGAGEPAEPWASASAGCLGDWVLLSALGRIEAGELFAVAGRPQSQLKVSDYPWSIHYAVPEQAQTQKETWRTESEGSTQENTLSPEKLIAALKWQYPYLRAAQTPSKLTATQLKGRDKDTEAAEHAAVAARVPQLERPSFIVEKQGLSPTEKGTAAHLFLQYADFTKLSSHDGVLEELDRMVDEEYLTEMQAEAVKPDTITGLFSSPLGQQMLSAKELIREFKFSILTDAQDYYPDISGEQVLLQGVVDAAILEDDGLTVIDFKTDRVSGDGATQRAEQYRGQLMTYQKALEKIFKKPVKKMVLYFLLPGKEVIL
jgi:ATP-dependent helicase/nuclease subunit A